MTYSPELFGMTNGCERDQWLRCETAFVRMNATRAHERYGENRARLRSAPIIKKGKVVSNEAEYPVFSVTTSEYDASDRDDSPIGHASAWAFAGFWFLSAQP
jgi:hypothetical protein